MSLHCLCFNGEGEDRFSSEGSRALSRLVLFQGLHSRQESEPHDVLTQDLIGLEDMAHHSLYWLSCSLTAFGSGSMPSSSLPATGIAPLHGLSNRMNAQRHGRRLRWHQDPCQCGRSDPAREPHSAPHLPDGKTGQGAHAAQFQDQMRTRTCGYRQQTQRRSAVARLTSYNDWRTR